MPRRRPPGGGPALSTKGALFALCLLPWTSAAAPQQQPPDVVHGRSPREEARINTLLPHEHAKPQLERLQKARKKQPYTPIKAHNERAVATTVPSAPADSAVRAHPVRNAASDNLSQASARSLQDWNFEDFVLLATVDGHIHARDRYNGGEIWSLNLHKPMLETIYNSKNDSDDLNGWRNNPFLWIVEPKEDGALYILSPGPYPVLQSLGMTVKQLAEEMSPYTSDDPPVVYTAEKKNTMLVVDARTGNITKMFSPSGSMSLDNPDRCNTHPQDPFNARERECKGLFNLGLSEYTIRIDNDSTGEHICTIKYSEWVTNQRDKDLQSQHVVTTDHQYIYSRYDGAALALDHKRGANWIDRPVYEQKLNEPVARVFEVARKRDDDDSDTRLLILPQPPPPGPALFEDKSKKVWLNTTEDGSWYLLSEANYPIVTDGAPQAPCYTHNDPLRWEGTHSLPDRQGLVGVHMLDYRQDHPPTFRGIAAPSSYSNNVDHAMPITSEPPPPIRQTLDPPRETVIETRKYATTAAVTALMILLCILMSVGGAAKYTESSPLDLLKQLRSRAIRNRKIESPISAIPALTQSESLAVEDKPVESVVAAPEVKSVFAEEAQASPEALIPAEATEKKVTFDIPDDGDDDDEDLSPLSRTTTAEQQFPGTYDEIVDTLRTADDASQSTNAAEDGSQNLVEMPTTPVKKKKTHRGKRGGQKGKNKKFKDSDEVEQAVDAAKQLNQPPTLHPDEITANGDDMQDISNTKKIGKLTIDFDRVLGNGSGGTFVFEGKWNDREVAVKRMLPQYFGLAEQEVKLLRESDDHANVIRYFDDEKDENFLYIAVELCQASLFDLFRDGRPSDDITDTQQRLVNEINGSVARALYQLAEGVDHLHSLRIIHRDIKPQNILIAYPKRNQGSGPRLVISDFGLCKTLPDNMSTLIGTTGNAGTVGWKAPELILQPRDMGMGSSTGHSRESSNSTDPVSQGVKRAVDIFSLGCVFYYVLTNGSHPFDDDEGWAQMREYNIKKNKASFSQLNLGDDSEEPIHLISWMLENRPEARPTAAQVKNHPFFWNAEKRLTFLCDCSDYWEREPREPPSDFLAILEDYSFDVLDKKRNFFAKLDYAFIASLGKQRKYTGDRMLDLLRALRNKKNHYEDMDESVKAKVGPLPHGYLRYWTVKFPKLLMSCYDCVVQCGLQDEPRFRPYFDGPNM